MKIISKYLDFKFNSKIVPNIIESKVQQYLEKYQKQNKYILDMDKYLSTHYNLSTSEILKEISKRFRVSAIGNEAVIEIDPNSKIGLHQYQSLIRFIDMGNIDVHGLNIVNTAMK